MKQTNEMRNGNLNISVQQMSMMSSDDYICIDTRGETAYQHGHIPGAVCLDSSKEGFNRFPENKKLVVYCTYGEKSIVTTEKLIQKGFEAYNLLGGYREWLLHHAEELNAEEVTR